MTERVFDRVATPHTDHLDKWPLTMATLPLAAKRTAMPIGVNWYRELGRPTRKRINGVYRWVIGDGPLGPLVGGHATCLRPWNVTDLRSWWEHYDQGEEGRCVEFASLRAMSLHNRVKYDITSRWHYDVMRTLDYWPGIDYEGTSVDAGMQVMRKFGAIPAFYKGAPISREMAPSLVRPEHGIAAYRWARDWSVVRAALGVPDSLPGVPLLNSWGTNYPKEVLLLDEAGARLLREDGEMALITDR